MRKPVVRLATDAEGETIRGLLMAQGPFDASIPFDKVSPYWLVAEIDGKIAGCVQTCPSIPIGSLEMLAVSKSLNEAEKGIVVRELLLSGCGVLYHRGSVVARGFIPFDLKGYKRALKKRGAVIAESGNLLHKRLRA